jgi:hypothetical protein
MVWFPGSWFGYIVHGYPVIRPDSIEFVVKIIMPLLSFTFLLVYCLRDKQSTAAGVRTQAYRPRRVSLFSAMLILSVGIIAGFIGSFYLFPAADHPVDTAVPKGRTTDEADDPFRAFCRREGYRQEVEALTQWLKEEHADSIAILYNEDDAYSHDLYTHLVQSLPDEKITVAFSDTFKEGDRSFFREMKALESAQPEAIIFMGTQEERVAFLESIAQQSQVEFWQKRRNKIRWIE